MEQDFHKWLASSPYLTNDTYEADWDYLPIYFNRYFINNDWGQKTEELQKEILRLVSRNRPTFIICEYDILEMQPFLDLCGMTVFIASRRGNEGIDIPLLCSAHDVPTVMPEKKWVASFVGNLENFGTRLEMKEGLENNPEVLMVHADEGPEYFVDIMLQSYIGLAPRGHGGSSFRFFEAMQLGRVPYLIGDMDVRPFKKWIDWSELSLYAESGKDIVLPHLTNMATSRLTVMGNFAKTLWYEEIGYGNWCNYVLGELECYENKSD